MTLKDVAAKAGCSIATASKALKNSNEISEEAKQRILAVAKELGYLKKATTHTAVLGGFKTVIFADVKGDSANLYPEIKAIAKKYGLTLLYLAASEKDATELMDQIGAFGVIVKGNAKTKTEGKTFALKDDFEGLAEFLKQAAEYMPMRPSRAADPEKVAAKPKKASSEKKPAAKKPAAKKPAVKKPAAPKKQEEEKKQEPAPQKKEEIWLL